jgi:hypothetical protein
MSSITDPGTTAFPTPAQPAFTRATVCCGTIETDYRRAGRGDTIVALAARDWRGAPALFPALAREFRLIVPEVDHPDAEAEERPPFAAWLSAFLDGLGLAGVTLLADDRFAGAALASAVLEPARVARLAVVLDAEGAEPPLATTDRTLTGSGTTLLVTWLGTDLETSGSEIASVLIGGGRPPG